MSRRKKILIAVGVLLLLLLIGFLIFKKYNKTITLKPKKYEEFIALKEMLNDSDYFKDSRFNYDEEKKIFIINGDYAINIKNGYYTMDILDEEEIDTYCRVVDAVEMKLGTNKGDSIKTCEMVLDGKINASGINVSKYEDHKVLSVNYREKAVLYDENSARSQDEEISLDEQSYTINIDDYLLSSINGSYDEDLKIYNICGNIYGEEDGEFVFKIISNNKEEIKEADYSYEKEDRYIPFCIEFKDTNIEPKYFKVHLKE